MSLTLTPATVGTLVIGGIGRGTLSIGGSTSGTLPIDGTGVGSLTMTGATVGTLQLDPAGQTPQLQILVTDAISGDMVVTGAVTTVSHPQFSPVTFAETMTVSGTVTRLPSILPDAISETMTLTGATQSLHTFGGAITEPVPVTASLQALRAVSPAEIDETMTVTGVVSKVTFPPIVGDVITDTMVIAGSLSRAGSVVPAGLTEPMTVAAGVTRLRTLAGSITETMPVTGSLTPLRVLVTAQITQTMTVASGVTALHQITPAAIADTMVVAGNVQALHVIGDEIDEPMTIAGVVSTISTYPVVTDQITETTVVTGTVSRAGGFLLPAGLTETMGVTGAVNRIGAPRILATAAITEPMTITGAAAVPGHTYASVTSYASPANRPAFTPTRTVNFTNAAGLNAALSGMQPGDRIKNVNTTGGFAISGEYTGFALHTPSSLVEIDLGVDANRVRFTGVTAGTNLPAVWMYGLKNLRLFGGDISNAGNAGILVNGSRAGGTATDNVTWWNFYIHDTGGTSLSLFPTNPDGGGTAANNTISNCDFEGEVTAWGQDITWDPHAEKHTGLHGCNVADVNGAGNFNNNRVALYAHDAASGAGLEQGQDSGGSISGNTYYLKVTNLTYDATSQVASNGINLWGNVTPSSITVGYIECSNLRGRAIDAEGGLSTSFAGVTVTYGSQVNCCQNPNLASTEPGISATQPWEDRVGIVYGTRVIGQLFPSTGLFPATTLFPGDGAPNQTGRWYSDDSAFNKPIPANPAIHSNSANFVKGLKYVCGKTTPTETGQVRVDASTTNPFAGSGHIFNLAYNGVPSVGIVSDSDATQILRVNYPPCGTTYSIPFPAGLDLQNDTTENSLALILPDGTEWDFYKITDPDTTPVLSDQHCFTTADGVTWAAVLAIKHTPGVGQGGWTGKGYGETATRESNTYNGAGMIRTRDFQTASGGTWDHAIALVGGPISKGALSSGQGSGAFWPANVAPFSHGVGDNNNNTMNATYCIPYGARIQLDPTLVIDQLNNDGTFTGGGSGNAPEWKKQYCRTLQVYGAYPVDSNSSGTGTGWTTIFQWPYTLFLNTLGFGNGSDDNIPPTLAASLRVLDWNDPNNY